MGKAVALTLVDNPRRGEEDFNQGFGSFGSFAFGTGRSSSGTNWFGRAGSAPTSGVIVGVVAFLSLVSIVGVDFDNGR